MQKGVQGFNPRRAAHALYSACLIITADVVLHQLKLCMGLTLVWYVPVDGCTAVSAGSSSRIEGLLASLRGQLSDVPGCELMNEICRESMRACGIWNDAYTRDALRATSF